MEESSAVLFSGILSSSVTFLRTSSRRVFVDEKFLLWRMEHYFSTTVIDMTPCWHLLNIWVAQTLTAESSNTFSYRFSSASTIR